MARGERKKERERERERGQLRAQLIRGNSAGKQLFPFAEESLSPLWTNAHADRNVLLVVE